MGYKDKEININTQTAPFLILEKKIFENLNVSSIARVSSYANGVYRLMLIPTEEYIDCKYLLSSVQISIGDEVLVLFTDFYGKNKLTSITKKVMHDYRNAVIIGKLN